jgi:predicted HAD superfamily Cof-like phosphohydrolase
MENQWVENLKEFHKAFDCVSNKYPETPDTETALLRVKLVVSEASELTEAIANKDKVEIFDAIIDLLYVTIGTAVSYGMADVLCEGFRQVHENNMSKLGRDGKPLKDESGKVIKPVGYRPVDLSWVKYLDGRHHSPMCPANHWHLQRLPIGPCICGA